MSSERNIRLLLQVGQISDIKSYFRIKLHSDHSEKSRVASTCGCVLNPGQAIIKLPSSLDTKFLDDFFEPFVTPNIFSELLVQGKVQKFYENEFVWYMLPLSECYEGNYEKILPILESDHNLSGELELKIETDVDGDVLKHYKEIKKSVVYAFFKSFKFEATTNLSKAQAEAASKVIGPLFGENGERLIKLASCKVDASLLFDSWEDVPQDLIADLVQVKVCATDEALLSMLKTPLSQLSKPFEAHINLNDKIFMKVETQFPGIDELPKKI